MKKEPSLKRKKEYPVSPELRKYLARYRRLSKVPVQYDYLLRYKFSAPLLDKSGNDTLWETVYYAPEDNATVNMVLTKIYAILKTQGDVSVMQHLAVERVDCCMFGNSQPFRIRIKNNYNDNYDYFYVKRADASRIYGLELEHILSPNRNNYIVYRNTLIEEHIAGIPGDQFVQTQLLAGGHNETRIAKEFVKFNERCFTKLLGDMRAYNFVVDVTPDFDDIQYRIRAIDFDQQCYEGRKSLYTPQFFKENAAYVKLGMQHLSPETVHQYQQEERSLMAGRYRSDRKRMNDLLLIMSGDVLAPEAHVHSLRAELAKHYREPRFSSCETMGEIVKVSLSLLLEK